MTEKLATDSGAERAARIVDTVFDAIDREGDWMIDKADVIATVAAIIREETGTQYAQGQLDEFLKIKDERPLDPVYWDLHEEERLRSALPAAPDEGGTR